ncbi:hypothetical protein ACFQ07_07875, partial [Actinomadura adrarensis]
MASSRPDVSHRPRFWVDRPSVESAATSTNDGGAGRNRAIQVRAVRLAPGVTVLLDVPGAPAITTDDLAAIEAAASPLLDELHHRGLLTDRTVHDRP